MHSVALDQTLAVRMRKEYHMRSLYMLCAALVLASPAAGETVAGFQRLNLNQMIDLDDQDAAARQWDRDHCDTEGAMDLFITADDVCCLALSCCCGFRIGAYATLYFSLLPYDSVAFEHEQDIDNPALFRRIDSLDTVRSCGYLPGIISPTGIGYGDRKLIDSLRNHFFIVRTSQERYALVKIREYDWNYYPDAAPPYGYPDCIQGEALMWLVQTDGGVHFSPPVRSRPREGPAAASGFPAGGAAAAYYTVAGRRIGAPNTRTGAAGVVIRQDAQSGTLSRRCPLYQHAVSRDSDQLRQEN
jgi:hypothetical protein